jgi:hypothetical protein
MAEVTFGEVDWNAAGSGDRKSDFMRLQEGENTVRIMGNPTQFAVHWIVTQEGAKKKIISPIDDPALVRRLEDSGFKRQVQYLVKVLDRADDEFKLLEIGPQIYNGIKALYNNARWGKVTGYDVTITKGPKGTQPLYGVTPNPKEALPTDLKGKFAEFNDRVNMDKFISPTPSSDVRDMMGWGQERKAASQSATTQRAEPAQTKKASDDDFDFDFE